MKQIVTAGMLFCCLCLPGCKSRQPKVFTLYEYNDQQIGQLHKLPQTQNRLSNNHLTDVNRIAYEIIEKEPRLSQEDKLLFYPYLANSQKEFYALSRKISGKEQGNFQPITKAVIRLFADKADTKELELQERDPYSEALTAAVIEKFANRLQEEKQRLKHYKVRKDANTWSSNNGYYGLNFGSITPWSLQSCSEHRCGAPNLSKSNLQEQIREIKYQMARLDDDKREAIHFWAYEGDWETIADNYMRQSNITLDKRLAARSALLSALADANGSVFDSKYSYWVKRPHMYDPSIKTVIPAPKHPSYPSGHSTIGKTAAVVLSSFFPERKNYWNSLAEEAGMSRIWAGIHFPMDHKEGMKLGEKIGNDTLKKAGSSS